MDFELDPNIWI